MKFEEIFQKEGLYIHANMKDGVAAKIDEFGAVDFIEYETPESLFSANLNIRVFKECFSRDWKKALTKHQLFGVRKQRLLNERTT